MQHRRKGFLGAAASHLQSSESDSFQLKVRQLAIIISQDVSSACCITNIYGDYYKGRSHLNIIQYLLLYLSHFKRGRRKGLLMKPNQSSFPCTVNFYILPLRYNTFTFVFKDDFQHEHHLPTKISSERSQITNLVCLLAARLSTLLFPTSSLVLHKVQKKGEHTHHHRHPFSSSHAMFGYSFSATFQVSFVLARRVLLLLL